RGTFAPFRPTSDGPTELSDHDRRRGMGSATGRGTGETFGRYELQTRLGQGGMGQVWCAFDSVTDRQVAVKVLPPELADDAGYRARFDREARAVSKLRHPNVVPIHNFGEID